MQLGIVAREGFAQRRQAGVFGVEGEAVRHGFLRGTLDEIRRGNVRFAEVEFEDSLHPHGEFGEFPNSRMRDGEGGGGDGGGHEMQTSILLRR